VTREYRRGQGEGIRPGREGRNLSADDPLILAVLGTVHTFARNYGAALHVAGRDAEAVAHYERTLQERANAIWMLRDLAPTLMGAGREEEARSAYRKLMQHYPDLTVKKFKAAMVFSPATLERFAVNLRKLGLPEE